MPAQFIFSLMPLLKQLICNHQLREYLEHCRCDPLNKRQLYVFPVSTNGTDLML